MPKYHLQVRIEETVVRQYDATYQIEADWLGEAALKLESDLVNDGREYSPLHTVDIGMGETRTLDPKEIRVVGPIK